MRKSLILGMHPFPEAEKFKARKVTSSENEVEPQEVGVSCRPVSSDLTAATPSPLQCSRRNRAISVRS